MTIEIKNWQNNNAERGFVAHFDANIDCGISLRDLALYRPASPPNVLWIMIPSLARRDRQAVGIRPSLRQEIGDHAAATFEAATGIKLTYQQPPIKSRTEPEDEDDDDEGLRRVIGETMTLAGL